MKGSISLSRCFSKSLTKVVLPALQGWLLQGGPCCDDIHVAPVVAGQRHFKDVLQHLTLAVHELRPHAVHCLQQQLPPCGAKRLFILKLSVSFNITTQYGGLATFYPSN